MSDEYLTISQVGENLNLTTRAVMGLIRKAKLPAYQFGREVRVKQDHFNDFVEKSRIQEGGN